MAVLLAVALFSVMLAKGLSASPQHSRYFGLDLLAVEALLVFDPPPLLPGLATPWRDLVDPPPPRDPPPLVPFLPLRVESYF